MAGSLKIWWALGGLLVAVAIYLCLVPTSELPRNFDLNDKLSHLLGHGAMALYFSGLVARRSWWKIFVFLLAFGLAIELTQHLTRWGRHGDVRDVVANSLGAAVGLLLGWVGLASWPQWAGRLLGQKAS